MATTGGKIKLNIKRKLKIVKSAPPLKGTCITDSSLSRRGNVNIIKKYPCLMEYIISKLGDDALCIRKYVGESSYIIPSLLGKQPCNSGIAVKYVFGRIITGLTPCPTWTQVQTDHDGEWYVYEPACMGPVNKCLTRDMGSAVVLSTHLFSDNATTILGIENFYDLKYFVYHCHHYSPDFGRRVIFSV